jgi:hypothetical protein
MHLEVRTVADVDRYLDLVRASAARAQQWVANHSGDPLDLLRYMKFEQIGFHPVEDRALNIIEQINQTWTFVVALLATRQLLQLHPEAEGFKVAPGAHMALDLDIMSEVDGLVGAETFAAVDPANNRKLEPLHDPLDHLLGVAEQHHGVVAEEQLVLDAGIAAAHAALDEQHGAGLFDVQDRHAVDRALGSVLAAGLVTSLAPITKATSAVENSLLMSSSSNTSS